MMPKHILFISVFAVFLSAFLFNGVASAGNPIATDSRIRTFVYGENEVFTVLTRYGYQSSLELAKGEKILTLSIGDPVAFKITPSDNRLFVKTLQNDRVTNMTVITDMRTYHFEISSKADENQDLVYVMRFYYPDDDFGKTDFSGSAIEEMAIDNFSKGVAVSGTLDDNYNYNYSMTGSDAIAPLKIFDDGRTVFFKFRNGNAAVPAIFAVTADGREVPVQSRQSGEYIAVDGVPARVSLRLGSEVVCVFNEAVIP